MAEYVITRGYTILARGNYRGFFFVEDTTTGQGMAGLATANFTVWQLLADGTSTDVTSNATITEPDGTNHPGWYTIGLDPTAHPSADDNVSAHLLTITHTDGDAAVAHLLQDVWPPSCFNTA